MAFGEGDDHREETWWIKDLPSVLQFSLNRLDFQDGNAQKINGEMKVPNEIYADRFLARNHKKSLEIRSEVSSLQAKVDYLNKCLKEFDGQGGENVEFLKAIGTL